MLRKTYKSVETKERILGLILFPDLTFALTVFIVGFVSLMVLKTIFFRGSARILLYYFVLYGIFHYVLYRMTRENGLAHTLNKISYKYCRIKKLKIDNGCLYQHSELSLEKKELYQGIQE